MLTKIAFSFFKKAQRQISVYFVDHIQLKKTYSGKKNSF